MVNVSSAATDCSSSSQRATPAWFTATHWSVVLAAGASSSTKARDALGQLCQTYWQPLYTFVRRGGYNQHDAQDLTQDFLAGLIEKQALQRVHPGKGRFRSFLLVALKHFLADARDRAHAQKRGGGQPMVPLDASSVDESSLAQESKNLQPDQQFDHQWAVALLNRVMARLAGEQAAAGKADQFNVLRQFLAGETDGLTYAEIAPKFQLSEEAARMTVTRLRRRYRELLRQEVANTVADPAEVDQELRELLGAVRSS